MFAFTRLPDVENYSLVIFYIFVQFDYVLITSLNFLWIKLLIDLMP